MLYILNLKKSSKNTYINKYIGNTMVFFEVVGVLCKYTVLVTTTIVLVNTMVSIQYLSIYQSTMVLPDDCTMVPLQSILYGVFSMFTKVNFSKGIASKET